MFNKFFNKKIMVTSKDVVPNTLTLFNTMRNNFSFKKDRNGRYAYVVPYIMIIDGQDILASISPEGHWVIGFTGIIEKPKLFIKKSANSFDAILGKAISKIFFDTYETSLTPGEFSILCTSRAVYTLDNRVALPICWLVIPNDRRVGLKSKKGDMITPLSIDDCFNKGLAIQSKHYLTSIIGHLVAIKDINLPIFSYKSSMHQNL